MLSQQTAQDDADNPPELQAAEHRLRQLQMQQSEPQRPAQPDDIEAIIVSKENIVSTSPGVADVLHDTMASAQADAEPAAPVTPEPLTGRRDCAMPKPRIRSNEPVLLRATGPRASGSRAAGPVQPVVGTRTTAPATAVQDDSILPLQPADYAVQPPIDADIAKESAELLDGLLRLTSPQPA